VSTRCVALSDFQAQEYYARHANTLWSPAAVTNRRRPGRARLVAAEYFPASGP